MMFEEISEKIRDNIWRFVVIVLGSAIIIICIIFAIPLKKVPVGVTETYTETEYNEEAYTESEPYTVQVVTGEVKESKSETLYDSAMVELGQRIIPDRWGTEIYFEIDLKDKMDPLVSGSWAVEDFPNAFYVTVTDPGLNLVYKYMGAEAAAQSDSFDFVPKYSGRYLFRFSTNSVRITKYARLTLVFKWDEMVPQTAERTEYKDVTKYRQVPVEVTKQKTVTKYENISIWEWLFR
jgi:hypothetical protein